MEQVRMSGLCSDLNICIVSCASIRSYICSQLYGVVQYVTSSSCDAAYRDGRGFNTLQVFPMISRTLALLHYV